MCIYVQEAPWQAVQTLGDHDTFLRLLHSLLSTLELAKHGFILAFCFSVLYGGEKYTVFIYDTRICLLVQNGN